MELRPPANARIEFAGVHPNVSTSIVVSGGQMRRTKEVKFVFNYRMFVDRPGQGRSGTRPGNAGGHRRGDEGVRASA